MQRQIGDARTLHAANLLLFASDFKLAFQPRDDDPVRVLGEDPPASSICTEPTRQTAELVLVRVEQSGQPVAHD